MDDYLEPFSETYEFTPDRRSVVPVARQHRIRTCEFGAEHTTTAKALVTGAVAFLLGVVFYWTLAPDACGRLPDGRMGCLVQTDAGGTRIEIQGDNP